MASMVYVTNSFYPFNIGEQSIIPSTSNLCVTSYHHESQEPGPWQIKEAISAYLSDSLDMQKSLDLEKKIKEMFNSQKMLCFMCLMRALSQRLYSRNRFSSSECAQ